MVEECIKCSGVLSVIARIVACRDSFCNVCMQYDVHSDMPRFQVRDFFKFNFRAMLVTDGLCVVSSFFSVILL